LCPTARQKAGAGGPGEGRQWRCPATTGGRGGPGTRGDACPHSCAGGLGAGTERGAEASAVMGGYSLIRTRQEPDLPPGSFRATLVIVNEDQAISIDGSDSRVLAQHLRRDGDEVEHQALPLGRPGHSRRRSCRARHRFPRHGRPHRRYGCGLPGAGEPVVHGQSAASGALDRRRGRVHRHRRARPEGAGGRDPRHRGGRRGVAPRPLVDGCGECRGARPREPLAGRHGARHVRGARQAGALRAAVPRRPARRDHRPRRRRGVRRRHGRDGAGQGPGPRRRGAAHPRRPRARRPSGSGARRCSSPPCSAGRRPHRTPFRYLAAAAGPCGCGGSGTARRACSDHARTTRMV
jgi:hypothetical protein